jgi:hypothetical protein
MVVARIKGEKKSCVQSVRRLERRPWRNAHAQISMFRDGEERSSSGSNSGNRRGRFGASKRDREARE